MRLTPEQIEQFDRSRDRAPCGKPGARDDERHSRGGIEGAQFGPKPSVVTEMKAVVAQEYDQRGLPEIKTIELIEQSTDQRVCERNAGVVAANGEVP